MREKVGGGMHSLVNRMMADKLFDTDWKEKKKAQTRRINYRNFWT